MGGDIQAIHDDVLHEPSEAGRRFFTIGEVSALCGVKPHVLRYWEHEFALLRPMKRRGNRRYYDHGDVLLIQKIRKLLYDEGFTIQGARQRLMEEGGERHVAYDEPQDAAAVLASLRADLEDLHAFLMQESAPEYQGSKYQDIEKQKDSIHSHQSGRGAAW